jgi:WD40 repeat protein
MISHVAPISGIASHSGKYVATAGYDNQVILWDAQRQVSLSRSLHDHLANQCEFSPDGRLLASSSSDYSARIWNVPDMKLSAVLGDHEDDVEGIAFHPTKPWIATSSRDTLVRVFDLEGRLLQRMAGHTADVISVAWLGDTDQLITSSDDGTIKRWDAADGRMIADIDLGGIETDTIVITPQGAIFAGNDEGQVIVIDGDRTETVDAHAAGIKRLIFDRQTRRLVSLSYDRSAKFWEVTPHNTLSLQQEARLPDIVWPRSGAYLSPDEVVFVTFGSSYATYNCVTREWDLSAIGDTHGVNGACLVDGALFTVGDAGKVHRDGTLAGETGSLCNFIIPFAGRILTGGQMGRVFDAITGEVYFQHRSPLNCAAAFEQDGRPAVIIGAYTGEGLVITLDGDRPVCRTQVQLHENAIKGVAASAGRIFSVCATGAAAWHDAESLEPLCVRADAHDRIANGCGALPGGAFVSVSRDLKLRFWQGENAETFETPHRNSIKCCAVSRDGSLVATGDYAGHVALFDVATRRYVATLRPTAAGISSLLAGHGDGDFLATSYDGRVYPLSAATMAVVEGA